MKIKNYFVKIKENITKKYNKNKKLTISIILLFIVILGYFIFSAVSVDDNKKSSNLITNDRTEKNITNYEDKISTEIEQMLLEIDAVSKAKVMVFCDSTETYHYLMNETTSEITKDDESTNSTSKEIAYEKDGSSSIPIIEYIEHPKIVGVMVVINNVSASTKLSILNSISIVLNIDTSCISIVLD